MSAEVTVMIGRDGTAEFDCTGCGQHIVRFAMAGSEPPICAVCLAVPGWQNDAQFRKIFGADLSAPEAS